MNPRAAEEWSRRSLFNRWTFYLWAVTFTVGLAFMVYVAFHRGIKPMLNDPTNLLLLVIYLTTLTHLRQGRPRRKKPPEIIRLNLD